MFIQNSKGCRKIATTIAGVAGLVWFVSTVCIAEQPARQRLSSKTVVVEVGTIHRNVKIPFSFSIENDLGTVWALSSVGKTCSCQELVVPPECKDREIAECSGFLIVDGKTPFGKIERTIQVEGFPMGFSVSIRGELQRLVAISPATHRLKEGVSKVSIEVVPTSSLTVKTVRIQGEGIVGSPLQQLGEKKLSVSVDFDTKKFDPSAISSSLEVEVFDGVSAAPIAAETVPIHFTDRTHSTPRKISVDVNVPETVALVVTSGEEQWFDAGFTAELRRKESNNRELLKFKIKRVRENTAVLWLELPSLNEISQYEVVLENEQKNWAFVLPVGAKN